MYLRMLSTLPMTTVFGPGITFPQGMVANAVLRIDVDIIRQRIVHNV